MASADISLDTAALLSIALESIAYGFSLLMFVAVWMLCYTSYGTNINWRMVALAVMFFGISTTHIVLNIQRCFNGFIEHRDAPGGPVAFFEDPSVKTFIVQNALYGAQTMIADALVIYRCYVVWQSFRVVIIPVMAWLSALVTGVFSSYVLAHPTSISTGVFFKASKQWTATYLFCSLSTNVLGSGLLAYRLWSIDRNVAPFRTTKSHVAPMLRIFVDSAILYAIGQFTTLVCFFVSNNGQYILVDMVIPIVSITFCSVIIRNGMIAIENNSYQDGATDQTLPRYPLRPLQVHITQLRASHRDGEEASLTPEDSMGIKRNVDSQA
ncbi:hypothetical protein BJ138DRAFT_1116715 [Hygrophoropsis aurantiaca]|uniref:Uncharacterized protein n=1 Tax=Hygrophoropsis aurantiaca TaxID=72124 RepID=A0ACB8A2J7_9AGAM|nr:hypothetical protein BJ138DRAFT_1116715 [Hygrophoropsis aurantiaca]